MLKVRMSELPRLSVTLREKERVSAVVGTPLITPVAELRVNPEGRVPVYSDQV